jgi:hypothetical protein
MRFFAVLLGSAAITAIAISGCGPSSPTSSGTDETLSGHRSIYATVDWTIAHTKLIEMAFPGGDTTITARVDIYKSDNSKDSSATITMVLNGVSYPVAWSGSYGSYITLANEIPNTAVKDGDKVVMQLVLGGTTLADSGIMPGSVSLSADGGTVTWAHDGNSDQLVIYPVGSNSMPDLAHAVISSLESIAGGLPVSNDLTSPLTIPQTPLVSGQWYELEFLAQQNTTTFGDSTGYLHVRGIYMKDYQKP